VGERFARANVPVRGRTGSGGGHRRGVDALSARPIAAGAAIATIDVHRGLVRSALQPLVAFAVVTATLLDLLQAAIAGAGLVRIVLIEAGVHPGVAGAG
jgi:hypothetical protein